MRTIATAVLLAVAFCAASVQAAAPDWMLELTLNGKKIEGKPLAWNAAEVHLLGRDGRLWQFPPGQVTDFRETSNRFRSYTPSQFRAELLRELGRGFEVSGTGHYLVAHPRTERDKWAGRFEDLYRSLVHYFSVRGFKIARPPFPLIGIVCPDQAHFLRYSAKQGGTVSSGVLGFYCWVSNRIILYDRGELDQSDRWQQTASVIIHEATHQTAFNTGIHSRWTPPPLWVAEGLATMFEAPGVYDSRNHVRQSDRINRGRLESFRQVVLPQHRPELLRRLIASDSLFRVNPTAAYAEAWALSFYLAETQPRKYTKYLALTGGLPPFSTVSAAQRTADFTAVFGDDWQMLQARFLRFMAGLK